MNLTQLRGLIAVADAGSFTAAAERLGLTQSGLSQALAALEESLGVKLLVRQRHGVELTAFGAGALIHARAAFAELDAIRQQAAATREMGTVRLAAFPSVFATVLPPLLRRFRVLYPDIDLTLLETDDLEVEAWLAEGVVDLGIVLNPSPPRASVTLGQDAWVAVVPATHRWARRFSLTLAELVTEPFVFATGGCRTHAGSLAASAGLSLHAIRIEVRDWLSAIALVREGAGVSLVPDSILPDNRRGLRVIPLTPPLYRRFGLVTSPVRGVSAAADLLIGSLRQAAEQEKGHRIKD